jgi:hypothetical protein
MVGSQSAPIGTPPQKQICETAQYLAAVYGWGPASVLKHTDAVNTRRQGGSKTKHLGLEMSATITPHPVTHLMP